MGCFFLVAARDGAAHGPVRVKADTLRPTNGACPDLWRTSGQYPCGSTRRKEPVGVGVLPTLRAPGVRQSRLSVPGLVIPGLPRLCSRCGRERQDFATASACARMAPPLSSFALGVEQTERRFVRGLWERRSAHVLYQNETVSSDDAPRCFVDTDGRMGARKEMRQPGARIHGIFIPFLYFSGSCGPL